MWSTSAGGHLMKVVNLTGFTVYKFNIWCTYSWNKNKLLFSNLSKFHIGTFGASATMFCRHNMSDQRFRGFPHGQLHRLEDGCRSQRGLTSVHCAVRTDGKERERTSCVVQIYWPDDRMAQNESSTVTKRQASWLHQTGFLDKIILFLLLLRSIFT